MPDLRVVPSSARKTDAEIISEIDSLREELRSMRQLLEPVVARAERLVPKLTALQGGDDA